MGNVCTGLQTPWILMCKPHIWLVLCLILYEKEGSLNLIKIDILVGYYWISYTPLGRYTPPWSGTPLPWEQCMQGDTGNLLECILVQSVDRLSDNPTSCRRTPNSKKPLNSIKVASFGQTIVMSVHLWCYLSFSELNSIESIEFVENYF